MLCIAGKNNIAVSLLKEAIRRYGTENVVAIPNKTDIGIDGWQRSYRKFVTENNVRLVSLIDVCQIDSLVFLSLEFDQLIRPERFLSDRLYNIHFSALPKYRGLYTSIWPILLGDETAAVTLHKIDFGIDTGDIIAQKQFLIGSESTSRGLYQNYLKHGTELVLEWLDIMVSAQNVTAVPQPKIDCSYYSKASIDFSNIVIDCKKTGWEIVRQVKAFCFRDYQLPEMFGRRIANAKLLDTRSRQKPGTVVSETPFAVIVSSIDYDVALYVDKLSDVLASCEGGHLEALRSQVDGLTTIEDRNGCGWSPLIVAAFNNHLEIVRFLVDSGADVNGVNYKGTSVLMYAKDAALVSRNTSVFEFLMESGSDPYQTDNQGKSLFDYMDQSTSDFLGFGKRWPQVAKKAPSLRFD